MENTQYYRPQTLEKALELLATEKASVLGGGVLLVPHIHSQRLNRPALIDISLLKELKGLRKDGDKLHIGPLNTMAWLEASSVPVLSKACSLVANLQIRNQATLGGNILSAARYSDVVPALLLLDTSLVFCKTGSTREVDLATYLAQKESRIQRDELLTDIILTPFPPESPLSILKVARKQEGSKALVTICQIARQKDDLSYDYRLAIGSAMPLPTRLETVEPLLARKETRTEGMQKLASYLEENLGKNEYKQHAIYTAVERALPTLLGGE
jgi:CO/xanthine dehydrogenase FAD-binding subunit